MTSGENMANILLQRLVGELNKLWSGKTRSGEERTQWRIK